MAPPQRELPFLPRQGHGHARHGEAPLTAASREEDYGSVPAERLAAGGVGGGGARQDGVDFV